MFLTLVPGKVDESPNNADMGIEDMASLLKLDTTDLIY